MGYRWRNFGKVPKCLTDEKFYQTKRFTEEKVYPTKILTDEFKKDEEVLDLKQLEHETADSVKSDAIFPC